MALLAGTAFQHDFLVDAVHHRFHVSDDSEHLSFALLAAEAAHHVFQGDIVQRAEAFVHEERFHAHVAAREVGNPESKRETHQELFATGEVRDTAGTVKFRIDHLEAEVSFGDKPKAVLDNRQVLVGELQERLEG